MRSGPPPFALRSPSICAPVPLHLRSGPPPVVGAVASDSIRCRLQRHTPKGRVPLESTPFSVLSPPPLLKKAVFGRAFGTTKIICRLPPWGYHTSKTTVHGFVARASPCALPQPLHLRYSLLKCGGRRGSGFGFRSGWCVTTHSQRSCAVTHHPSLHPVATSPPQKSGVWSCLRHHQDYLSASALRKPTKKPTR